MPMLPAEEKSRDVVLGYTLLRVVVGVNILSHGISRILSGPADFAAKLVTQFQNTPLANGLVNGFGTALPWVEAVLGAFLLLGIATRWTLLAAGALLAALTYGACLVQDWQAAAFQLIYAVIYAMLLILRQWNSISIDGLFRPRQVQEPLPPA